MRREVDETYASAYFKGTNRQRFHDLETELREAWNMSFRKWWQFLNLSEDYWWCCQENGKTKDLKLKKVYVAFGDVSKQSFAEWWMFRGRKLFLETISPEKIVKLTSKDEVDPQHFREGQEVPFIYLRVPVNISQSVLVSQFRKIHAAENPQPRKTTATFKLKRTRGIKESYYEDVIKFQAKKIELNRQGSISDSTYFELGEMVGMWPAYVDAARHLHSSDIRKVEKARDAKKLLTVNVIRMLERTANIIANVEIGEYPCHDKVEPRARWTPEQEAAKAAALSRGEWQPRIDTEDQHKAEVARLINERAADEEARLRRYEEARQRMRNERRATRAPRNTDPEQQ